MLDFLWLYFFFLCSFWNICTVLAGWLVFFVPSLLQSLFGWTRPAAPFFKHVFHPMDTVTCTISCMFNSLNAFYGRVFVSFCHCSISRRHHRRCRCRRRLNYFVILYTLHLSHFMQWCSCSIHSCAQFFFFSSISYILSLSLFFFAL